MSGATITCVYLPEPGTASLILVALLVLAIRRKAADRAGLADHLQARRPAA